MDLEYIITRSLIAALLMCVSPWAGLGFILGVLAYRYFCAEK